MTKYKTQKFKIETAFKLLKIAKDDVYAAVFLTSAPKFRPEIVLYLAQQGIEKSIKAVIIFKGMAVPLVHDLDILIELIPTELTENLPSGIGELSQFATIRRYTDGDELIEDADIQAVLKLANLFTSWADQILNP